MRDIWNNQGRGKCSIQKLLCEMQIQGQLHQAAASLETI